MSDDYKFWIDSEPDPGIQGKTDLDPTLQKNQFRNRALKQIHVLIRPINPDPEILV